MTYAPAPYAAPVQMTDPTNVMGRRIGAYFIDVVVPTVIAIIVGFTIWFGNASRIDRVPTNAATMSPIRATRACNRAHRVPGDELGHEPRPPHRLPHLV